VADTVRQISAAAYGSGSRSATLACPDDENTIARPRLHHLCARFSCFRSLTNSRTEHHDEERRHDSTARQVEAIMPEIP